MSSKKHSVSSQSRVRLRTFGGTQAAPADVASSENYWLLVGKTGMIQAASNPEMTDRVLVRFEDDLAKFGLENHNEKHNSLWILKSDLEVLKRTPAIVSPRPITKSKEHLKKMAATH